MNRYIAMSLLLLIGIYGCNHAAVDPSPEADRPIASTAGPVAPDIHLPAFKMVDLTGRPFDLADFKGK